MTIITIGQAVAWTKVTKKGKTIDFKRCDGVVEAINQDDGTAVIITGTRRNIVSITNLKKPEEYTDLQDVIETMRNRHKEQP